MEMGDGKWVNFTKVKEIYNNQKKLEVNTSSFFCFL